MTIKTLIVLGLTGIVVISSARADTITFVDSVGGSLGGQYTATTKNSSGYVTDVFETFCIEKTEYLDFKGTFDYTISYSAVLGGKGGGSPDPVSIPTAWLFAEFSKGTLDTYGTAYDYGVSADADQLQTAIWYLEDEIAEPGTSTLAYALIQLAYKQSGKNKSYNASGEYGVYVINPTWRQNSYGLAVGSPAQSVLAIPDGGATLALMGLSLGGLAFFARRKST